MSFTGNENHEISLQDAAIMTKRYRQTLTSPGSIIAHFFSRSALEEILAQENCVGIRFYYALDAGDNKQIVATGVKANEDDIFNGYLAEHTFCCPAICGTANPLNSDV